MKMTKEHYDHIKSQIESLDREQVLAHKRLKLGNDVNKRFRWDLFNAAKLYNFASSTLYDYLNDTHIDTALKQVVIELDYS